MCACIYAYTHGVLKRVSHLLVHICPLQQLCCGSFPFLELCCILAASSRQYCGQHPLIASQVSCCCCQGCWHCCWTRPPRFITPPLMWRCMVCCGVLWCHVMSRRCWCDAEVEGSELVCVCVAIQAGSVCNDCAELYVLIVCAFCPVCLPACLPFCLSV